MLMIEDDNDNDNECVDDDDDNKNDHIDVYEKQHITSSLPSLTYPFQKVVSSVYVLTSHQL